MGRIWDWKDTSVDNRTGALIDFVAGLGSFFGLTCALTLEMSEQTASTLAAIAVLSVAIGCLEGLRYRHLQQKFEASAK